MFKRLFASALNIRALMYYACVLALIALSFYIYAPPFFKWFNSDQAIHALMARQFEWPRDVYYWGQNRLGSLLPMLAAILVRIGLNELWACALVQYAFLIISFCYLQTFVKSRYFKIFLLIALFYPIGTNHYLVLIGHPYATQLFLACGYFYFLNRSAQNFLQDREGRKLLRGTWLLPLFGAYTAYFLGIWVSELSAAVILFSGLVFVQRIYNKQSSKQSYVFLLANFSAILLSFLLLKSFKSLVPPDQSYDHFLISSLTEFRQQLGFMVKRLATNLDFSNSDYLFQNLYACFAFVLIYMVIRKLKMAWDLGNTVLLNCVLFGLSISGALLLSAWVLRSECDPKYFIPAVVVLLMAIVLSLDQLEKKVLHKEALLITMAVLTIINVYNSVLKQDIAIPRERFASFQKLEPGTFLADYWECYLVAAFAPQLDPLPYDYLMQRNAFQQKDFLQNEVLYLVNNGQFLGPIGDTLNQFGQRWVYTERHFESPLGDVRVYQLPAK